MSCQQASRVQEDPYAFTEPAPLPANTSLYKHSHAVSSTINTTSTSPAVTVTASPVIQAGTSLLTSNNISNSGVHNALQNRTTGALGKVTPIKVTLVQPMGKPRLNGTINTTTMTTSPSGAVFRTVSVPQATTIVQRSPSQVMVTAGTNNTTTSSTVFTKPLQVQISPQQTGKFSRRVLASKSPNVSPAAIQTVRIVKSPSPQQPIGGRPSITPDARRYLNHSSNSLLGPPPATTAVASPAPLQSVSPTKIRLIQPQPQGKIFLHTPNSSSSLAAATHISNPASIAALRNSLARQNPSLLNKVPIAAPQQISSSNSIVLPSVRPTTATSTTINIRRPSPPSSQTSLETATTTVPPPPPSPIPATTAPVISAPNLLTPSKSIPQNSPAITSQRARTPTTSILKPPQPVQPPSPQDDIGFPIPSFVIHKQAESQPPPASPLTPIATDTKPIAPVIAPSTPKTSVVVATAGSSNTTATTPSTPKTQGRGRPPQADRSNTSKTAQHQQGTTGKRMKRSYSRSSHHETLERIPSTTPTPATTPGPQIKEEEHEDACETKPQPATVRLSKWKPPGAIAIPMNREWHAPDSYIFDICSPGSMSYSSLARAPCVQEVWFNEIYASTEMDTDAAAALFGGMRPRKVGRKALGEDSKLLLNLERDKDGGELKKLSRDERLELKRSLLRRKAVQYWNGQKLRMNLAAKKRFRDVEKFLSKVDHQREMALKKNGGAEQPKCQRPGCGQVALLATTHCYQHITDNSEQRLFQQCTAKFSDNSQCRVPVFDISHELILCREHAWKHDNHDKMSAEVKMLKKPGVGSVVAKKKLAVKPATITTSARTAGTTTTAGNPKKKNKKKKLTPLQQQLALHQQQYKQQYSNVNHSKPTLPPPAYGTASGATSTAQIVQKSNTIRQTTGTLLQQPPQQMSPANAVSPGVVQIIPPQSTISRNVHIPLSQQLRQLQQPLSLGTSYQHLSSQPILQQPPSQQHMIGRNDDLMLNFTTQQLPQQQQASFNQQHVQQMLSGATTQDLLNICENSSAYASSEDTGVGGLSESELMAAQDVIEEIPFEIGNLNNVLSQLPADAFNELLFSEQEQNGPTFESTQEEEEDLERALEVVGEHVKSLEDMTVESANFLGDFLDNVDDEMLDGSDICSDQMLQSPNTNDIRGLVHT